MTQPDMSAEAVAWLVARTFGEDFGRVVDLQIAVNDDAGNLAAAKLWREIRDMVPALKGSSAEGSRAA